MKNFLKLSFAALLTALMIAVSVLPAFAANELAVNGKAKANKGDTVTYTLKLGDCTEKLEGIQMYIFYDRNLLEIDESSLEIPELKGAVYNAKYKDGIAFNWTSVTDLVSFEKPKILITVDFKVKKTNLSTDISYFITEMYGKDMTYLKSFTLTNDVSVNGKKVIKNETPVLSKNSKYNNEYQGSLVNYADGKGEKNGSGKNHVQVTGVTTNNNIAQADTDATNVTKGDGTSTTTIIVVLGITLAVIAIIILVILRRHFTKDTDGNAEE